MRRYQSAVDDKRNHPLEHAKEILSNHIESVLQNQGVRTTNTDAAGNDARIRGEVAAELESEPTIDATAIEVHVESGVVTLRGSTDGVGDQWLIESAVMRIAGVRGLRIELAAIESDPGIRTDEDIRRDCEHILGLTVPGADHAIRVMVSAGWVTLSGNVSWGYERQATEEIVSRLMGVIGVNGQLRVRRLKGNDNAESETVFK